MTVDSRRRYYSYSHYIPHFSHHPPPPGEPLQTHDRGLVDPRAPKTISNARDFSENNPFTVPAGVLGLDEPFHHYLRDYINPIGISLELRTSRREIIVNRNSRLERSGGVRRKSRRWRNDHFPDPHNYQYK